jgi:excisionase family DNA binding protein
MLTVKQAAVLAACHEETVRRAYLAGFLKVVRVGRSIRVFSSELQKWLQAGGQTRAA